MQVHNLGSGVTACGTVFAMSFHPWSVAWDGALYGPAGFFQRSRPLDHFRTSTANPLYAEAVLTLAERVDVALGRPDPFDVVDVGAGGGELLAALSVHVPSRWRLTGVDLRPRPATWPRHVTQAAGRAGAPNAGQAAGPAWSRDVPPLTGVLLANEWLDSIPLDVLLAGRLLLVGADGQELPGAVADPEQQAWADRWWPAAGRVEVGLSRDHAWAAAVGQVGRGLAVAADYGHLVADRRPTLTGYRDGRQVRPVPDGSCDLTAHVALDSCAAATGGRLLRQAEALAGLGISPRLPEPVDPSYAFGLQRASQARELLDVEGLGGFGWLLQEVGLPAGSMGL